MKLASYLIALLHAEEYHGTTFQSLQYVFGYLCERDMMKLGFHFPGSYIFRDCIHIFIGPAITYRRTILYFPRIHICAFYPVP